MSKKVPDNKRLRPRELFFVLLGVTTGAALAVLWFRLVPTLMQHKDLGAESLSALGSMVMHPAFQVPVLLGGAFALAAGIATRTSSGRDKATWILAAGSIAMFGALLLSVNAVYDPVFLDAQAVEDAGMDDDWED